MLERIKLEEVGRVLARQINPSSEQKEPSSTILKSSGDAPCTGGCGKILPRVKLFTSWADDVCPACEVAQEEKYVADQKARLLERHRQLVIQCRAQSGMTDRELQKTFSTFKASDENAKARAVAVDCLTKGNLMLIGDYGVGKTHLALAMVNAWCDGGRPARFYPMGVLLADARRSFEKGLTEADFIEELMRHPLVVDDFGTTKVTEWSLAFMDLLIDQWYRFANEGLVLTSNFYPSQISSRISARIGSRLNELCRMVELKGADRRI